MPDSGLEISHGRVSGWHGFTLDPGIVAEPTTLMVRFRNARVSGRFGTRPLFLDGGLDRLSGASCKHPGVIRTAARSV